MSPDDKVSLAKNSAGEPLTPERAARALAHAATEAGALALSMQRAGVRIWNKDQNSPVTEADIAVDALLRERLTAAAPDFAWQSEESIDVPNRPVQRRRWVVDPIDGTRSFIRRRPDWSIAAALVEDGRPIAAALFVPVADELFVAFAGGGVTRNGVAVSARTGRSLTSARIAGPRAILDRLAGAGISFEAVPRIHSLALRLARVAAGDIDVALANENSRDWDLAAADLLVHEAGGALTTVEGGLLIYDRPDARHPPLAAAGVQLHPVLIAALGKVLPHPARPDGADTMKVVK